MAGITGIVGSGIEVLEVMLQKIKHRGPHETWSKQDGPVSLGCNELNVGGNCPNRSHFAVDGDICIVLDGRLYNADHADAVDAEKMLRLYQKFGTDFAKKADGDFACAICHNSKLILARDWAGIKPLYYGHHQGNLCFASEAKALVGIADDVKEFPPGYIYSSDTGFQRFGLEEHEVTAFCVSRN